MEGTGRSQKGQLGGYVGLVEHFGLHVLLEVSIVGIADSFLNNTIISMLVGICIVEGCQFLWRTWRKVE